MNLLWGLQSTCLSYLEMNDRQTGSDYKKKITEAYDENRDGVIDYLEGALAQAFNKSKSKNENADPLFPGRTWGKGKWPSLQYAMRLQLCNRIYGMRFPNRFDLSMSPYGHALRYADYKWNGANYCTQESLTSNEDVIGIYHKAIAKGARVLPFVFYVPKGFGDIDGAKIPNVEETDNPGLIFSASFNGNEVW